MMPACSARSPATGRVVAHPAAGVAGVTNRHQAELEHGPTDDGPAHLRGTRRCGIPHLIKVMRFEPGGWHREWWLRVPRAAPNGGCGRGVPVPRSAMSDLDRTTLPIRRSSFQGVTNRTLAGSQPDWNLIAHPTPPEGAPNVLLVLDRRRRVRQPQHLRWPDPDPELHTHRGRWPALQPVPRRGTVFADPSCAPDRSEQSHCRLRVGRRVRGRVPGILGDVAPGLRAVAPDPQGERVQHSGFRQVAPDPGRPAGPCGSV